MSNVYCSIEIKSNIENVYKVAETYPHFISFYQVKEILYNDEERIDVKVGYKIMGIPTCWIGHGKKEFLKSIKYEQVRGILKNMTAHWIFMKCENGTTVEIIINLEKTLLGAFFKSRVKKIIQAILADLKMAVENK